MHNIFLKRGKKYLWGVIIACIYVCLSGTADAQSLKDQAKMQYYQSMIEEEHLPFQEKESFFDSILNYYRGIPDSVSYYAYLFRKMNFYYEFGSFLEAYKTGLDVLGSFQRNNNLSSGDSLQMNETNLIIAKSCSNLSLFDESITHLFSIIQQPYNRYTIEAYSYLGFYFMQMGQMENSKIYNDNALKLLSEADNTIKKKSSFTVYNNVGGYYYNKGELDSALHYLNLAVNHHDEEGLTALKSVIFHNMAIIYQEMGEYGMAENYLYKAIELAENEPYKLAIFKQNLAFLMIALNKSNLAETYYLQALQAAEESNAVRIKASILTELSDLYYKKHQYQKAYNYFKKGVALRDSIFSVQNMEKISLLTQQFENYKIVTEKDILEKELQLSNLSNQKKSILLTILISLLILFTVAAFIIIKRIGKSSAKTLEKKAQVTRDVVKKEYESTLEEKNRELASNALFLMRTNEMLTSLQKSIRQQLATTDPGEQREITEEMASIINSYNSGQGWDEFKLYFEQVHHSFYTNLNKINPNLSKMEQRLCALLVLNMNTKEIAQVTNRSVRTVETLIYRLRKNLNIPPDEKTVQFLRKLLEE